MSVQQAVAMLEVVRRRISARLAVMRAGAAAAAYFAAVALRQLLRCSGCSALRPNGALVRDIRKAGCSHAQRLQLRSDVVGVMVGPQYATQIVKTLHCYLDATLLYRAVSMPQASSSRLSRRFRPARRQETSPDASRSRDTLTILPGEVYFRGASPHATRPLAPRQLGGRDLSSEKTPT